MSSDNDAPGRDRDWWWLDDLTSLLAVIVTVLLVLGSVGGTIWLLASGTIPTDVEVTGEVELVGTIPVGIIITGTFTGIAILVSIILRDIYGRRRVERATDQMQEMQDE